MDKGYIDFGRLYNIHNRDSYFVARAKDNLRIKRKYSRPVCKVSGVMSDQIGKLGIYNSKKAFQASCAVSNSTIRKGIKP